MMQVEFAPGFGPLDVLTDPDWVDLSDRLLEASWSEGRDDELEHYGPGEATIVLRNEDRALDPDNASGPYVGELLPRTPFRIRELGQDRFYGFVDSGFEQDYEPPNTATCTVKLTDRLSAVAGVLPDVFDYAIQSLSPDGLWVLDADSSAESVADASGNGQDGTVVGDVKFGEPPIASGHGTSAKFTASANNTTFGRIELSRSPLIADPGTSATVVATFKAVEAPADQLYTLFVEAVGTLDSAGASVGPVVSLSLGTNGKLHVIFKSPGSTVQVDHTHSAETVVDGKGHLVIAQPDGLALDSAVLETVDPTEGLFNINGVGIGGYPGINPNDHWLGWIGTVAIWNNQLSLSDREAIVEGYTKLSGLRSDEHIAWALDRIGVPAAHRNLDQGTVLMGPADTRGRDALEYIREVVATEQGEFYVDHRDGGKLRFRHRYARFVDSRSTTSQATFSDDVLDANRVGIQVGGLDVAPNGIDGVVNQASVKWRDGDETVEDSASVLAFGPQGRSVTTQATTATQARSAGEWLVARYAQPRSRVRGITTRPDASAKALDAARNLKIGDRVSYRFHPQRTGSITLLDLFVEGVDHSISDGTVRVATYRLAPVNTFTPWIWGTSAWGTTKFWG